MNWVHQQFRNCSFIDGIALGAFVAAQVCIGLFYLLSEYGETNSGEIITLATAGAALAGAFVALGGSRRMVEANRASYEQERRSKLDAYRATLPLVLSNLYNTCETRQQFLITGETPDPAKHWTLNSEAIEVFRACIEYSEGAPREALKEILAVYQVCIARFTDISVDGHLSSGAIETFDKYERANGIIDWIALQALCESLFDYSRSRSSTYDRDSVPKRAIKFIEFLHDPSGWVITNDKAVEFVLENQTRDGMPSFSDPDWQKR